MITKIDSELVNVVLDPICTVDSDYFPGNAFYRVDVDNDGLNDIVVSTKSRDLFFAILNRPDGAYEIATFFPIPPFTWKIIFNGRALNFIL